MNSDVVIRERTRATPPTTPNVTLVPPAGLTLPNPQGGAAPALFCLFTQDWVTLQGFIGQALTLPINVGDFESKYGTFTDEQDIDGCVAAMQAIQALGTDFGDPQALMAELARNPAILQSDTAPPQVYTHIVWFATRLYQAATTFNQTLAQLLQLLNPAVCGTRQQCALALTQALTGTGGLQSTANGMVDLSRDLVSHFSEFTRKLSPSITAMDTYTGESSKFLQDVDADIQGDTTDEDTYQASADAAYKLWRDLTIAATTTSIGVMVISLGMLWPVSVALAGGLGDAAAKARKAYDDACASLAKAQEDERKKRLLRLDLVGFNTQMAPTDEAAQSFLATLQEVTGVWLDISGNIDYIAKNFTPEQLGDLNWVMQAMALDRATSDWKVIADKSQEYTANSLVTYTIHRFGDPLPPP